MDFPLMTQYITSIEVEKIYYGLMKGHTNIVK